MAAKVRELIASLVLAGSGSLAAAQQPPAPFPVPAMEEPIEIYYGTKRVTPEPMPEAPAVVPVAAVEESPKAVSSFLDAMASVREGTREISSATVGLLGKVGDRVKRTADSRPIIINTTYPTTAAVTPAPIAAAAPQVVVVKEAVEARPAVGASTDVHWTTLLACSMGLVAVGIAAWAATRRAKQTLPLSTFAPTPLPLDPNGVSLMGKYNAGPKRETAEKFDLGPTYHEELQQKEQVIEANNTAAVEFILNQNLELLAALNPGSEGEMVETDGEGFAVPAMA